MRSQPDSRDGNAVNQRNRWTKPIDRRVQRLVRLSKRSIRAMFYPLDRHEPPATYPAGQNIEKPTLVGLQHVVDSVESCDSSQIHMSCSSYR
jgi:hypothetical protein